MTDEAMKEETVRQLDKRDCVVREGMFVEPCAMLAEMTDTPNAGFSKAKGIARWHYTDMATRQPSRTFFGAKSKEHPNGMLFNFCPWCGTKIDAPFAARDDAQNAQGTPS